MGDNNESLSGFAAKTKGYERYKKSLFVTCDTHISYIEFLSGYFGKALISSLSFLAAARSSLAGAGRAVVLRAAALPGLSSDPGPALCITYIYMAETHRSAPF